MRLPFPADRFTRRWVFLFAAVGSLIPPAQADPPVLPVSITATDPAVYYSGRFRDDKSLGMACQWPASAVTLRFSGTDLNVQLSDGNAQNHWQIVIDGQPTGILPVRNGTHTYPVAAGLPAGPHTAELIKCTESLFGITRVVGFELNAGGQTLPAVPPRHRMEVVGDSISCGFGNTAASPSEHLTPENENAWLAYGAVAARLLDADYTCIAWSGKKIFPDNSIADLYDCTLPNHPADKWNFKGAPAPEVVVITLGTNDLGQTPPDAAGWIAAYEAFIARVRGNYPGVAVYCATSPMLGHGGLYDKRATLHEWLIRIVGDLKAAGDKKIFLVDFPTQDPKNGIGAAYHPSVKTHALLGEQLAAAIKKDLGW